MPIEHRRHGRYRFRARAAVTWVGERGECRCTGNCIDVSVYGMMIEIPVPIPIGAQVTVDVEDPPIHGPAIVRHLRAYSAWYRIGLNFNNALFDPDPGSQPNPDNPPAATRALDG